MPEIEKWNWETVVTLSIMIVTACGLFILAISLFRLDEQAYQMLAVVGADSVFLGLIAIKQRRELAEMRELRDTVRTPERREEIIAEWKAQDKKEAH